jgi:antitoxin VapB
MRKAGERLVIEPKQQRPSLLAILASLEPIEDEFPPIEELPYDDVDL